MGQIQVTVNGRAYSVTCDEGEEAHVAHLARYVEAKVGELVRSVGQVGDARLLLMASLVIADELAEAEGRLRERTPAGPAPSELDEAAAARTIDRLTGRIEAIAARLQDD